MKNRQNSNAIRSLIIRIAISFVGVTLLATFIFNTSTSTNYWSLVSSQAPSRELDALLVKANEVKNKKFIESKQFFEQIADNYTSAIMTSSNFAKAEISHSVSGVNSKGVAYNFIEQTRDRLIQKSKIIDGFENSYNGSMDELELIILDLNTLKKQSSPDTILLNELKWRLNSVVTNLNASNKSIILRAKEYSTHDEIFNFVTSNVINPELPVWKNYSVVTQKMKLEVRRLNKKLEAISVPTFKFEFISVINDPLVFLATYWSKTLLFVCTATLLDFLLAGYIMMCVILFRLRLPEEYGMKVIRALVKNRLQVELKQFFKFFDNEDQAKPSSKKDEDQKKSRIKKNKVTSLIQKQRDKFSS